MRFVSFILVLSLTLSLFGAALASDAFAQNAADLAPGARSAVLCGADGAVIWSKNGNERLPMASTTKIMTALAALDVLALDKRITAVENACGVEGSSIYMKPGETFTAEELLYALLLQSANDAATLIALECSGSVEAFADLMNEKAAALGLGDTHFSNPHGLDAEEHYTSALDLARLSLAALSVPKFEEIVSTLRHTIGEGESARTLVNHNRMLTMYDGAIGVKTGFTKKSGRCLVSAARRDNVTIVAVTLNDGNDWNDHKTMLDHGFDALESVTLCEEGALFYDVPCTGGTLTSVRIANAEAFRAVLPKNHGAITVEVFAPHFIFAPVTKGDAVGTAVFRCGGKDLGSVALVASDSSEYIKKKGFFERLLDLYR